MVVQPVNRKRTPMGNWNINIQGIGPHHNEKRVDDAEKMAKSFVTELRRMGHTVQVATFTWGSMEELGESTLCNPGELKRLYAERQES